MSTKQLAEEQGFGSTVHCRSGSNYWLRTTRSGVRIPPVIRDDKPARQRSIAGEVSVVDAPSKQSNGSEIYGCAVELSRQSENFEKMMPPILTAAPGNLKADVAGRFLVQAHFDLKAAASLVREVLPGIAWQQVKALLEKQVRLRWILRKDTEKRCQDFLDFRLAEEIEWHRALAAYPKLKASHELEHLERVLQKVIERRGDNEGATFYHQEEWCPTTTALIKEIVAGGVDEAHYLWLLRALPHRTTGFPRDPDTDPTASSKLVTFYAVKTAFEIGADCERLLDCEGHYVTSLPFVRESLEKVCLAP